jgi:hypothetical protein
MRMRIPLALVVSFATFNFASAAEELETRMPTERKELDRDDNEKIDAYTETYALSNDLSVRIFEQRDEQTQAAKGQGAFILYREKEIWSEMYVPSLDERHTTVSPSSPFVIGMSNYGHSGTATVALIDNENRLVATLVRKKTDGSLR